MKSKTPRVRTLYHFTCVEHLDEIRQTGLLRTTESNVSPVKEHAGPDVVWLLDAPDLGEHDHGLSLGSWWVDKSAVRFTVRVRGVRWLDWPPAAQMDPAWKADLVARAGGMAAARHWWLVERPIPASEWEGIDVRVKHDGSPSDG